MPRNAARSALLGILVPFAAACGTQIGGEDPPPCWILDDGPVPDLDTPVELQEYSAQELIDAYIGVHPFVLKPDDLPGTLTWTVEGHPTSYRIGCPTPDDYRDGQPTYDGSAYMVPSQIHWRTEDGQLDETWSTTTSLAIPGASTYVGNIVMDYELQGSIDLRIEDEVEGQYDSHGMWLLLDFDGETVTGEVDTCAGHVMDDPCADEEPLSATCHHWTCETRWTL